MDDTKSSDGKSGRDEFYLPATFQFSTNPGRIERLLVGWRREDDPRRLARHTGGRRRAS